MVAIVGWWTALSSHVVHPPASVPDPASSDVSPLSRKGQGNNSLPGPSPGDIVWEVRKSHLESACKWKDEASICVRQIRGLCTRAGPRKEMQVV